MTEFSFNIAEVAGPRVLGLTFRRENYQGGNIDADCPFCYGKTSDKKGKLNLNVRKNVFRCNYCDAKGGMLELYARLHGISNSDAYREISEILGSPTDEKHEGKYGYHQGTPSVPLLEIPKASPNAIHQTYSLLLNTLTLSKTHKDNLLERGLVEQDIEKFRYRSVPAFGQKEICEKLVKSGCVLEGVPGFYKDEDGRWTVKLKAPGFLIPVRAMDGKISAIQIRLNKSINSRKYIWMSSSDMDGGSGSGSPIHFVGDPSAKRVFITEGPLKGDTAHSLTHYSFICIPGVNSIGKLDEMLTALRKIGGCEQVIEAFDADKLTNPHVAKALENLHAKVKGHGFDIKSAVWDDKALNGIDEYYLWRWKEKQKTIYSVDTLGAAVQ